MYKKAARFVVLLFSVLLVGCNKKSPYLLPDTSGYTGDDTVPYSTASLGYTAEAIERAESILDGMSLEEKVGQMFLARCPKKNALEDIETYHLGGYILFADDFKSESKSSMRTKTDSYQNASKIPMLIGVDEEGGRVVRISKYKAFRQSPFLPPRELFAAGGFELIKSDTEEKCELLASLGVNLNIAPVCDISADSRDYIYDRTFGGSAAQVSEYVRLVTQTMQENNISAVLKHFPGYGSNRDTHSGIAYDNRSYSEFVQNDFLPFISGIEAGAGCVLVSHNVISCMDESLPASLSEKIHMILREGLGFTGVIMTDDLSMNAVKDYIDKENAAIIAVLAGNDIIIATEYREQIPAVINAVADKRIPESLIDRAAMRVLLWKIYQGIL